MFERQLAAVLVEFVKNFNEDHLHQIFFADTPGQMRAHEFEHERTKMA